jgi:hypothetical protein
LNIYISAFVGREEAKAASFKVIFLQWQQKTEDPRRDGDDDDVQEPARKKVRARLPIGAPLPCICDGAKWVV